MQRFEADELPGLKKTLVVCRTCGITDSFYSDLSVEAFKVKHSGHDVQGGEKTPKAQREVPRPTMTESTTPSEAADGVKVTRVLVDLFHDPALPEPSLRVRGYVDGVDEVFGFSSEEGSKVKDIITKGRYLDESTGQLFVWEGYAVDFEDGTADKLEAIPGQPLESGEKGEPAATPVVEEPSDQLVIVQEKRRQEATRQAVVPMVPAAPAPIEEEVLLVSKSWYVQGGNKNREEALRVSRVLKGFRWRVEPIYTIGVVLDDLLSIETSRNEVSRDLIVAVEGTGYRLSAVTSEGGMITAWFKRSPGERVEPPLMATEEGGLVDEVVEARNHAAPQPAPN